MAWTVDKVIKELEHITELALDDQWQYSKKIQETARWAKFYLILFQDDIQLEDKGEEKDSAL